MDDSIPVGFVFLCFVLGWAASKEDLKKCKNAETIGYSYPKFYQFEKEHLSKFTDSSDSTLEVSDPDNQNEFTFHFYVKAESDAHILLSSADKFDDGKPSYEIVIGGGKNTFAQIRLQKKVRVSADVKNIMSGLEYRGFWIKISKNSTLNNSEEVSVGEKDKTKPFMRWLNGQPFPVRYFSLGSWWGVKAEWLFGCPQQHEAEFVEVEQNYTALQRLRRDLLTFYDPYVIPSEINRPLVVKFGFTTTNLHLAEVTAELTVDGHAHVTWRDEKLVWEPETYEGIKSMYLKPYKIWTPNIRVLNGVEYSEILDYTASGLIVTNEGNVSWHPSVHFSTYCAISVEFWPQDIHNCSIHFGFWAEPPNLQLEAFSSPEMLSEDRTGTEWQILHVSANNPEDMEEQFLGAINLFLYRRHDYYVPILLTPFLAAVIMVMASFWIQPDQSGQLFLCCANIIILTIMLLTIGEHIPAMQESVPYIVRIYIFAMIVTCIPLLLAVWLRNISESSQLPKIFSVVLRNNIVGTLLCLPTLMEDMSIYSHLKEEKVVYQADTKLFAIAVERISFFVYFFAFTPIFLTIFNL